MNLYNIREVVKCLAKLGYREATNIQKRVFVEVTKKNKSVIVVAPTGTGKTEAAVFPVMNLIYKHSLPPVAALYISPLRALNRDLEQRLKRIGKCFGVSVALRHGDTPESRRRLIVSNPPHLLITTPETLSYLMINNTMSRHLENLHYVIIDEFRDLLESKRGLLLLLNLYLLEKIIGRRLVKIALTATLSDEETAKKMLAFSPGEEVVIVRDHSTKEKEITITLPPCNKVCEELVKKGIEPELAARISYILEVLEKHRGTLIFTNTRSIAEKLGVLLDRASEELGLTHLKVGVHHGSLSKKHRIDVEDGFRRGEIRGLIATSSMELGIDIGNIDYVIQYMSPRQAVRLEQRIGRSGHRLYGKSRGSIVVTDNLFQIMESIVTAKRSIHNDLEKEEIIPKPLDVLAYALVIHTIMNKETDLSEFYGKITQYHLYRDLYMDEYKKTIEYLDYARILRIKDGKAYPTRKSRLYIYLHTMIPDTRDIPVIEASTRRKIGVLSEEYVVLNINIDDIIVLGGKPWRVLAYDEIEGKLYVEEPELRGDTLVIPHWEGENIPVDYETAVFVGDILGKIKVENCLAEENLHIDANTREYIEKHVSILDPPPPKTITIYYDEKHRLVYVVNYGGTKLNRLLRDLIRYMLKIRFSIEPYTYSTPYSIIIANKDGFMNRQIAEYIASIIENMENFLEPRIIRKIARSEGTLHWRIYQVAQRFGAINIRDKGIRITRHLLDSYADTVIGDEAFKEVLIKDYDIEKAEHLAHMIRTRRVKVVLSTHSRIELLRALIGYSEKPLPPGSKPIDEEKYLKKLLSRRIKLICIKCGYIVEGTVKELLDLGEYRCPKCRHKTLAPIKRDGSREREIILKFNKGMKLRSDEKRILEDLRKRAMLLLRFGGLALEIFASMGVGTSEAIRIINQVRKGGSLAEELYKSEVKYLRIKKYLRE